VIRVVMLTDRSPAEVLPAAPMLLLDLKVEQLSAAAVGEALALGTDAVLGMRPRTPAKGTSCSARSANAIPGSRSSS